MPRLDGDLIRHALGLAREHGYAEVELSIEAAKFHAILAPMPRTSGPAPSEAVVERSETRPTIDAPLVGYYRASTRGLWVGQQVRRGDSVAEISALGILNEVECRIDGEIVEVLVSADEPVQFGQPLAVVKPITEIAS